MKKYIIKLICICILSSVLLSVSCFATSNDVFKEYLLKYKQIPAQSTYNHNWFMDDTIGNHGNDGIVASKIIDIDSDGESELLLFFLVWDDSTQTNSLYFSVYENINGSAVKQAQIKLSDSYSCFSKTVNEDLVITIKNNCIGFYYKAQIIEGSISMYMACTYDGSKINTDVYLFDPGYTDGIGLYDVTYCSSTDYYTRGIELISGNSYEGYRGIYPSYEDAIKDKIINTGITAYYDMTLNDYAPSFEYTTVLCSLESYTPYMNYGPPYTTYANFYQYSNALNDISVNLDGRELIFDQPPIMEFDRVLVPIRVIFEALGYTVNWHDDTQTAVANNGKNTITVQIDNPDISYNNGTYLCDVPPKIIAGRTLVPVRAISESAGCVVDWNDLTNTVIIISEY